VVPNARTAVPAGPRGRFRALVLVTVALAVLALAAGGTAVLLVLAMTTLGTAGVLILRARSAAAHPSPDAAGATPAMSAADVDALPSGDLTERLRQLYAEHVEQTNMAVAEDRFDLVEELSDSYMNQALRLITAGASPDWLPAR
jgi:hypothetical protein